MKISILARHGGACYIPAVIPAPQRLMQKGCEFKANLSWTDTQSSNKQNKTTKAGSPFFLLKLALWSLGVAGRGVPRN